MKNLSVRLLILVSIGLVIYFFTPKNNNKTQENKTNEVVTTTEIEQDETINKEVEHKEEIETKDEVIDILVQGQKNVYSNGDISYSVELDTLDRIVITKVVPSKMDEGWFWVRKDCKYTNKHIYVNWITTEYYIKNNELIVVESGKTTKFNLIETNF